MAWVIGQFEAILDKVVALPVLMPIVDSIGGLTKSQTLTLAIRGLAVGQMTLSNRRWLGDKKFRLGFLTGTVCSTVVALVTHLRSDKLTIMATIAVAMLFNLVAAAFSSILNPSVLHMAGIDPTLSREVMLTAITDIIGFFSFNSLAPVFLL